MTKVKGIMLLLLGILVAAFAWENVKPAPPLKLFGFDLMVLPTFIIVYSNLLVGFLAGWIAHALKVKRNRRAALESAQAPEHPDSQETHQSHETP